MTLPLRPLLVLAACLSTQAAAKIDNGVAVLIGSSVATNPPEPMPVILFTALGNCTGGDATPPVPGAPVFGEFGALEGWVIEYVDNIVVMCGSSKGEGGSSICLEKPFGGQWSFGDPLYPARSNAASAVVGGSMYVLGGRISGPLPIAYDVQRRDPDLYDGWETLPYTMPTPTKYSCAAALDDTHLMIIGGQTINYRVVADVSILDVTTGLWLPAEPLLQPLKAMACLSTEYRGQRGVMVTGGCNDLSPNVKRCQQAFDTVSFFSAETQSWDHDLPKTLIEHQYHRMTHIGGSPAVIASNIEVLDGESWVQVASQDQMDPPNAPQYFDVPRDVPDDVVNCIAS